MKLRIRNILCLAMLFITAMSLIPDTSLAGEVTIIGEINEEGQLVSSTDGFSYRISKDKIGDLLVSRHRGNKVRVVGDLLHEPKVVSVDEPPTGLIQVTSFEDLAE